jgi:outer membrane protein OmpA-like peptidoglycan-associated protein
MNILNIIREQLSPELLGQISKTVGENPEGTKSALQQALPALLGSAAAQASSPSGANGLLEMLKQKTPQGGWPESLSGLLGSFGGGSPGSSFVSSLLGPKMNAVRDFIAGHSGVRSESATSLMGMGGQILMGILGKQVMARGLGASGLGQLLSSQIPHLQGLVPPELANTLGIGNFLGMGKEAVTDTASQAAPMLQHARTSGGSALRWAIPLALVLGAIWLIYQHNRRGNVGGTADEASKVVGTAVTNGSTLGVNTAQAFTDRMKAAIASGDATPVALQGVDFDSSGNLSQEAQAKLSQLGTLISENPSLHVTITTYGNGVEEATTKARAIETALVKTGLEAEKITTKPEVGQGLPKISFAKWK